jgi:hypothetical protein
MQRISRGQVSGRFFFEAGCLVEEKDLGPGVGQFICKALLADGQDRVCILKDQPEARFRINGIQRKIGGTGL